MGCPIEGYGVLEAFQVGHRVIGERGGSAEQALASPMDITGRPMRGFVWVAAEHADGADLPDWIELAACFVDSLPPKWSACRRLGENEKVRGSFGSFCF